MAKIFSDGGWQAHDLDEFQPAEEGETGTALDEATMRERVSELIARADMGYRQGRFHESVHWYVEAERLLSGHPIILSNRSAAYCRISQLFKDKSAVESEYQPLNGLHPTAVAELALEDAEKVISLGGYLPKSYFLNASALILLERYDDGEYWAWMRDAMLDLGPVMGSVSLLVWIFIVFFSWCEYLLCVSSI